MNAEQLVAEVLQAWRPPKRLTLSEWSDAYAFLSAESAAQEGRWRTLPYQKGVLDAMTDPTIEQIVVIKSARVGYALALDTPVPTVDGWTTMGEVKVGDRLFDERGQPCSVTFVSPIFTDHDCFEVEFCDGTKVIADRGHRWFLESDVSFEHLRGERGAGRTGRPKPGQVATTSGVIDTGEMAAMLRTSRGRNALAVPVALQLNLPPSDLPMPPYTLGLWLGDGHMVSPRITQHRSDVETARHIEAEGVRVSVQYTDARYPNNATYFLDCAGGRKDPSPWASVMRRMGVLGNKHIPPQYLRASVEQRLELLRGLMDSDGNLTGKTGAFAEFVNTNEELAQGVFELVVSLGMKARISTRKPKQAHHLLQYRVVFRPSPLVNPFKLSRKAARVRWPEKPTITTRRRVVSVRPVDPVPVRCISVDSPSHLFLCTRSMVPTHNTKCLNNLIGYHIHQDPCSIMLVQPTIEDAEGYSKEEIAPMLRDTAVLRGLVADAKSKDSSNTILAKSFPGGTLSMVGANSPRGFRRVSRRVVLFDEIDGYPPSAGAEGDQIRLGIRRSEYFHNRKIVMGSTPTIKGHSRVETEFELTDKRRYFVPCPHCGEHQVLRWSGIRWPKGEPAKAFYVCEHNGCIIQHSEKYRMIERGEWRATAEASKPGLVGFHIWAAYSYSPNATWGQLATEFVEAKGDPLKLKTFVNTVLGETWEEKGERVDDHTLAARAEDYDADPLPDGVVLLTAGTDVQPNRLESEVIGWGLGEETWSVDYVVTYGNPDLDDVWAMHDAAVLNRVYTRSDGVQLRVARCCVDSGGANTAGVYQAVRARLATGVLLATKGVPGEGKPVIGSPTTSNLGKIPLFPIGTFAAKDLVMGRLRINDPGPGYCHLPKRYRPEYFKGLTAEEVSVKYTKGFPVREFVKIYARNEPLDCRVLATAAFMSLNVRIEELVAAMGAPQASRRVRGSLEPA